jgi:hypothetical protein
MAELRVEGTELVVHLRPVEKVESMHGDLRIPLSSVQAVELLDDAHTAVDWHGIKAPGTRIPCVVETGTFIVKGQRVYAVVVVRVHCRVPPAPPTHARRRRPPTLSSLVARGCCNWRPTELRI